MDSVLHLDNNSFGRVRTAMGLDRQATSQTGTLRYYLPIRGFWEQSGGLFLPLLKNNNLTIRLTSRGATSASDATPPTLSGCRLVCFCQDVSDAQERLYEKHQNSIIDFQMTYNQVWSRTLDFTASATMPSIELQSLQGYVPWLAIAIRPVVRDFSNVLTLSDNWIAEWGIENESGQMISPMEPVALTKNFEDSFDNTMFSDNNGLIPVVYCSAPKLTQFLGKSTGGHVFTGKQRLRLVTTAAAVGQRQLQIISKVFALVRIHNGKVEVYSS
jgi:hypothetical protein